MEYIDPEKIKEVLKRERPEANALSPFIFKKVNLKHLEIDKEIILKFRKATTLDSHEIRESMGKEFTIESFSDLDIVVMTNLCFRFLTNESKRELAKIKIIQIDDNGEEIEKNISLIEKMKLFFVADTYSITEIYNLLLDIFGYTKDIIDKLFDPDNFKQEQKKKTN